MCTTRNRRRGINALELLVVLGAGSLLLGMLIPAVSKVRAAAARSQSINNLHQMGVAVHNIASISTTGDIPPAHGVFHANEKKAQSFFTSLLPYLEQGKVDPTGDDPIKAYIAPADPNNKGTNSAISYGSNATVLTVNGNPRMPKSFNNRTSSIIIVFERTAKSEATWNNEKSYLTETEGKENAPGKTIPEFTPPAEWKNYATQATAITWAGCAVAMGDGSSRIVTKTNATAAWAWAMNPANSNMQPEGW